jgi:hypothetical protein
MEREKQRQSEQTNMQYEEINGWTGTKSPIQLKK